MLLDKARECVESPKASELLGVWAGFGEYNWRIIELA
jgi:hypothetical protein